MTPIPFAQIQATPPKQIIEAVSGTISQVFNREQKAGNFGPFMSQRIMIAEAGTNTQLRVTLYDADPLTPANIGQLFTATLGQNNKGALTGLFTDHYQSQTQGMVYAVKCSKGGLMFLNNQPFSAGGQKTASPPQWATPPQPQPQQQWAHLAPPPQPQQPIGNWATPPPVANVPQAQLPFEPRIQAQAAPVTPQMEQKSPLSFLTGHSAAYVLCFEAALRVRAQLQVELEQGPGEPLSTSDVKEIATTFYIEGNRRGIFNNVVGNVTEEFGEQP